MDVDTDRYFKEGFACLTGTSPFGWQRRLFARLLKADIPPTVDIPTGLGKTSVIPLWVLAFARQAERGDVWLPRRLVYVVNRRTVVDQATDVALRIREALAATTEFAGRLNATLGAMCLDPADEASPLAISTLRGELADNRYWQNDPVRPTIVIGTVDMIGSRLLFSGYGLSARMRPLHAGLLGHDALIVHDEAHLTRPFSALLRGVAAAQSRCRELRPLRVMELSATHASASDGPPPFTLNKEDLKEPEVARRVGAMKRLLLHGPVPAERLVETLAVLALKHEGAGARVVLYLRSPKTARDLAARLESDTAAGRVKLLTGTVRGYERDKLASDPIFLSFRPDPERAPLDRTVYLVSTSAGEVGLDIDADHMVSDLNTLDSMIQRLGRVNRLGRGRATVDVVDGDVLDAKGEPSDAKKRVRLTRDALESLPAVEDGRAAGPLAVAALFNRSDLFSRSPRALPLTDVLLDAWALTRLPLLPGRPPVARWLHGVEAEPPQLSVAWREEIGELKAAAPDIVARLFDAHPLRSREQVRGNLSDVIEEMKKILRRHRNTELHAVLLPAQGDPQNGPLEDLLERRSALNEAVIVLPQSAGGLDENGMLDGSSARTRLDVADDTPHGQGVRHEDRRRVLLVRGPETSRWSARVLAAESHELRDDRLAAAGSLRQAVAATRRVFPGMIEKDVLTIARNEDGEPSRALVLLVGSVSVDAAQESPSAAARAQELWEHAAWARDEAVKIVERLKWGSSFATLADAVAEAAHRHDRGKDRPGWQKAIGHPPPQASASDWKPWAKSDRQGFDATGCGRYRHEFGSLRDASLDGALSNHVERDLVLHLIAAHHGWARPHFDPEQWDIADGAPEQENHELAAETLRRFARMQRRFGHWGLAWLEAIVRSADYAATRRLSAPAERRNG